MGKTVLPIGSDASSYLRAYAHCSRGSVSALFIQLEKFTMLFDNDLCEIPHRLERGTKHSLRVMIFVRSHIDRRGERSIPYKGVETSP